MVQEKILNQFTINLERENFSIYVKQVDRSEQQEKNLSIVNEILSPTFASLLYLGKTTEQYIFTRSDKVEISLIKVEGLNYNWELCVFNDTKGLITQSLKNEPLAGIESFDTKDQALKRIIELLLIV